MQNYRHKTRHETVNVEGLDIFYRHAGEPGMPAILLLHGYPNSSYAYRNIIEPLAETAYVVAPDLPAFGFSSAPSADAYDYTFENIADTIGAFLAALDLERFFLFVTDFGTPVGYHLATRRPDRIRGLIVQNGNAHDEGLGPDWDAPKAFFADPTEANRAITASVIWTLSSPSRLQYTSSSSSRRADSSSVSPIPIPNGTANRGSRFSSRVRIAPAPAANAMTMPGTKWWMWRRPTLRLRNGPTRVRRRSR
jgi:pimeloyl-ACP methyl ester carboxylesterase